MLSPRFNVFLVGAAYQIIEDSAALAKRWPKRLLVQAVVKRLRELLTY
jgi:hypothetical protein